VADMRRILLVLLTLTVSCSSVCQTKIEPTVDVPVNLKAVNALHDPPVQTVVIERRTQSKASKGGACGHAVVCVLFLPILAFDALFPDQWDEVTIADKNGVWFEGRYSTNGDLVYGTLRTESATYRLRVLDLKELGRRVVVKSFKSPSGESQGFEKMSVLEQVPLDEDYKNAISDTKNTAKKTRLALEATAWLGEESRSVFLEYLKELEDEALSQALPELILGVCTRDPFEGACLEVLGSVQGTISDNMFRAIFQTGLSGNGAIPADRLEGFLLAALEGLCDIERGTELELKLIRSLVQKDLFDEPTPTCSDVGRTNVLRLGLGKSLSEDELMTTVADPLLDQAIEWVPRTDAAYTRFLVQAVEARPDSVPISSELSGLSRMDEGQLLSLTSAFLVSTELKSYRASAHQLDAMKRASSSLRPAKALELLSSQRKTPTTLIARAVLGERHLEGEAAIRLGKRPRMPLTAQFVSSEESLISFGLRLNGCDSESIRSRKRSGQICKP